MCGIYGITERNKKLIESIILKCSHRGPDGSGIHESDNLTLGHNLLSITSSASQAKQPWISDRQNVLIFNGHLRCLLKKIKEIVNVIKNIKKYLPQTTCIK